MSFTIIVMILLVTAMLDGSSSALVKYLLSESASTAPKKHVLTFKGETYEILITF